MFIRAFAGMTVVWALLTACGGSAPEPVAAQPAVPRHATTQVGDVTVRANALRTASLDAAVAERYGIAREPDAVLLLVGVRRGDGADEVPIAADVAATVTDLRGQRHEVEMRELHGNAPSGEPVLDYFGVVEASPPDTLRFDIEVDWDGGPGATLRVEHELRPD
ncbi:MAG TPA: DUF4426 domain-containing protein [Xanthomonadaceae bacterium]|nr:DUF4426 domain-containing protein [Xanthomonadaceae bacterium]